MFGNRIEELSNTEEDYKARIENLRTQLETSLRQCNERSSSLQTEITDMQEKLSETLKQVAEEATTSVSNAEASEEKIYFPEEQYWCQCDWPDCPQGEYG